ncbi:MAG: dependent epimerase/dehydratase family [Thermoleophilaceae bacterium]|jgi:nucleoside-diphosphate-sugar epimerase|nr:dependent epimerase/dehydratase family [Thermoleophilaceae bacterium]
MRVLVAGATGTIGAEVLDCLAEHAHWTRALTRSRRAGDWLRREPAEVAVADATDPSADLKSLCVMALRRRCAGARRQATQISQSLRSPVLLDHPRRYSGNARQRMS